MTDPFPSDSDVDLAEQAAPVGDDDRGGAGGGAPTGDFVGTIEANPVDVYEQQQSVPFDDEDRPAG